MNHDIKTDCMCVILHFEHDKHDTEFIVNVLILFDNIT